MADNSLFWLDNLFNNHLSDDSIINATPKDPNNAPNIENPATEDRCIRGTTINDGDSGSISILTFLPLRNIGELVYLSSCAVYTAPRYEYFNKGQYDMLPPLWLDCLVITSMMSAFRLTVQRSLSRLYSICE